MRRPNRPVTLLLSFVILVGGIVGWGPAANAAVPNAKLPALTTTVWGSLRCESLANAFSGSPASLTVKYGETKYTFAYQPKITHASNDSIFKRPSYALYQVPVRIPAGVRSVTVNWSLTCYDGLGKLMKTPMSKAFTVGRVKTNTANKTICYALGGPSNPCQEPKRDRKTAECYIAVFTAGVGSAALSWGNDVVSADSSWSKVVAAASRITKVGGPLGIVLSCAPLVQRG